MIERFTGSKADIAHIMAPAGFGKTVLLIQLTEVIKKPVLWYHLDSYDNDPALFLRYLIAGCQRHNPHFGRDIVSLIINNIQTNPCQHRAALSLLMQGLERFQQDITLVFDDCHVISKPWIIQFMEDFIRCKADSSCRISHR